MEDRSGEGRAKKEKKKLKLDNRNLILGLALTGVFSLANNVYATNVFPNFLLDVAANDTFSFGFAEGLQGLSQLITAFPIGWAADRYKRKYLLWLGGVLWLAFIALQGWATYHATASSTRSFIQLCIVLCIGGVTNGIIGGPLMALLDDSVEAGFRSDMELYYSLAWNLPSVMGPVVALICFSVWGNTWSLDEMKLVIYIGCALTVPCVFISFFFDDDKSLGKESEAVTRIDRDDGNGMGSEAGGPGTVVAEKKVLGFITREMIPWFLFLQNLFAAIGAGMTVKFFPLFFTSECQLSPIQLQIVYIFLPLAVVAFTVLATKLSKRVGRMQVIIPFCLIGIVHTASLAFVKSSWGNPFIMIPLYLSRCAFMWSTGGLSYSIIADYVPKEYRARWNTLESIASFGWSGSALLGGKLVQDHGYQTTFVITACLQLAGVLLFACPLVPLVAKENEIQDLVEDRLGDDYGGAEGGHRELEEPLLRERRHVTSATSAPRPTASSSIRGLPGMNATFEEAAAATSLSRSLGHLDHMMKAGSLG